MAISEKFSNGVVAGYFNSADNGADGRRYQSENIAVSFDDALQSGAVGGFPQFQVEKDQADPSKIRIKEGRFIIRGHYLNLNNDLVSGAFASPSQRADIIVVRVDRGTREISIETIAGTDGNLDPNWANIQRDDLQPTSGVYEVPIAIVNVNGAEVDEVIRTTPQSANKFSHEAIPVEYDETATEFIIDVYEDENKIASLGTEPPEGAFTPWLYKIFIRDIQYTSDKNLYVRFNKDDTKKYRVRDLKGFNLTSYAGARLQVRARRKGGTFVFIAEPFINPANTLIATAVVDNVFDVSTIENVSSLIIGAVYKLNLLNTLSVSEDDAKILIGGVEYELKGSSRENMNIDARGVSGVINEVLWDGAVFIARKLKFRYDASDNVQINASKWPREKYNIFPYLNTSTQTVAFKNATARQLKANANPISLTTVGIKNYASTSNGLQDPGAGYLIKMKGYTLISADTIRGDTGTGEFFRKEGYVAGQILEINQPNAVVYIEMEREGA